VDFSVSLEKETQLEGGSAEESKEFFAVIGSSEVLPTWGVLMTNPRNK